MFIFFLPFHFTLLPFIFLDIACGLAPTPLHLCFGLNTPPTTALVQAILDVDAHILSESIPMDVIKNLIHVRFF
jgi:hypothetical protein